MASVARPVFSHRPVYKLSEPSPRSSEGLVSLPLLSSSSFTRKGTGAKAQVTPIFGAQGREHVSALAAGWLTPTGLTLRAVRQPLLGGAAPLISSTLAGFSNTVGSSTASNASTDIEMAPEMQPTAPTTVSHRGARGGRGPQQNQRATQRTVWRGGRVSPSGAAIMPVAPSGAAAGEDEEELAVLRQQFAAARSGQVAGSGTNAVATNAMHRAATADAIDPRLSPPLSGTTAAASVLVVPGSAGLAAAGPLGATMPAASGGAVGGGAASGGVASGGVASGIAAARSRAMAARISKKSGSLAAGAAARYAAEMAARAEAARTKAAEARLLARSAAAESAAKRAATEQVRQPSALASAAAPSASSSTPLLTTATAGAAHEQHQQDQQKQHGSGAAHDGCTHAHAEAQLEAEMASASPTKSCNGQSPSSTASATAGRPTSPRGFGKVANTAGAAMPPAKRAGPSAAANHVASAVAAERAAAVKAAMLRAEANAKANEPPSPEQREKAAAAAARAAKRLSEGDAPVLTIELLTGGDGGKDGGGKDKGELLMLMPAGRTAGAEKAEPLDKDTPVSVSTEKGSVAQALPGTLHKASTSGNSNGNGGAPAARLTNTSGGPVLGHLSVGGAKVAFAMYESHARQPAAEGASAAGASHGSKFLEAVKGLGLNLSNVKTAFTAANSTALSGAFVAHPQDGLPQQRVTVVDHTSGVAIEAAMVYQGGRRLRAFCRRATVAEVRRAEAIAQLKDAEEKTDYALLHGRIVAARARGVEARRLEQAEVRLKQLKPDMIAKECATKEELVQALRWDKVTCDESHKTGDKCGLICCEAEGCTVGEDLEGSRLEFETKAAEMALTETMRRLLKEKSDFGADPSSMPPDRWLFEQISGAAAAAAAEGGVWRSGGKFILSAITRNQSPVALNRYLKSIGQHGAADGIDALVKWTESHYDKHVSAVQINIHIDTSSFHAQHRDIYGLEQRDMAGRDCTCSFKPNIATACLSMGSTRRCLVEAEVDDFSQKKACGEGCKGYHCSHWLRSGSLMYFNDVWNKSHTHGIPQNAGDADEVGNGGPRISVALLCAAAEDDPLSLTCGFKPKNIYSTLVDKQAEAKLLKLGLAPVSDDGR